EQRPNYDERLSQEVPGRKWQQIQAFVQALPVQSLPILEWCAGKGHLGRLAVQAMAAPVLSLEIDAQLCQEGQRLANRLHLPQQMQACDVLDEQVQQYFQAEQQDRKSTRLNSSHVKISYAVFCLKKKKKTSRKNGN